MSTEVTSTRTFHSSDYARAARLIQRMRHVKGHPYTGKADQSKVDQLAGYIAEMFNLDAHDHKVFDRDRFMAGTQLPAPVENVLLDSPPEDDDTEE